jgi:hypothetical protein
MRKAPLLLILVSLAFGQQPAGIFNPSPGVPVVATLPATCVPNSTPSMVSLATATSSTLYFCVAPNTWIPLSFGASSIVFTGLALSPTQAVVSYTAPNAAACTFSLNEGSALSANQVNDTNTALFAGSNLDTRAGSYTNSTSRVIVLGKRTVETALDSNLYSRALAANTVHHLKVICSNSSSDIVFSTSPGHSGATFPEPYGPFPNVTMSTTKIVDNLTGTPLYPVYFNATFPAGSFNIFCTANKVTSADGKLGYACTLPATGGTPVLFLDVDDKIWRNVGSLGTIFATLSGDGIDTQVLGQNLLYASTPKEFLVHATNAGTGANLLLSGAYANTWGSGDLSVLWTNLTPSNTIGGMTGAMQAFNAAYSSSIAGSFQDVGVSGDGGYYVANFVASVQDSIGWVGIFNSSGTVVAALQYYAAPSSRWCFNHAVGPTNGAAPVGIASSDNRYVGTSHGNWQADHGNQGDGPYLSYTTGPLTATPTYSLNASVTGFSVTCSIPSGPIWAQNLSITGCDTVTVGGEPCDPTPNGNETGTCSQTGHTTEYFLQNTQVGDRFQATDNLAGGGNGNIRENFVLLGKNGTTWLLGRGASDFTCLACNNLVQNHTSLTSIGAICTTNVQGQGVNWNWQSDPNGTGSGTSVDFGPGVGGALNNEIASHSAQTSFEAAGVLDFWNCPTYPNTDCLGVKYGTNFSWIGAQLTSIAPGTPNFSATAQLNASAYIENYSSAAAVNPSAALSPVNTQFVLDARPAETVPATWTNLTGNIYQVTSSLGAAYDPKRNVALASCAGVAMTDVSSATTSGTVNTPVAALNTANTYCTAKNTNECYNGSTAGNVYVNCSGGGLTTGSWITLSSAPWGKVSRLRWDMSDSGTGISVQPLTNCVRKLTQQASYWSARVLAGGDYGLCWSDLAASVNQSVLFVMGLPPMQPADTVDRTTWVPAFVTVPPGPGGTATAYLNFGYVENGSATSYFCMTRQEVCVANSPTVGATPFFYAGEVPTGTACASGCTVAVPGISGRTAYLQAVYFNGGGTQIGTTVLPPTVIP